MQAEAYVGGILRGGRLENGVFIFHAGTVEIRTTEYDLITLYDNKNK